MKILIDAHMVGENETGNERYIVQLVNALKSLDVDADLLVAVAHQTEAERLIAFGSRVRPVRVSSSPIRRLLVDLPGLVRKECVDLLHVTYMGPLQQRCPMVVTIHDMSWRVDPSWFSPRDYFVLSSGSSLTARRATRIITISQHAQGEIHRYLNVSPERTNVTPLAAAPQFTPKPYKALQDYPFERWAVRRPYILAVGNLQPRKNLPRLVEAFSQLVTTQHIPHHLVLAGKAKWRESEIHRMIRRLGVEDRIVFTGRIPDEDLACLLCGASLFVYPSLYEGFGLPVLEAMACGTPVVTSNCTSIPEVAGDAALLVDPTSIGQLADAIHRVLSDEELHARLRERGLARARMYSWQQTAMLTWAAYCQTTEGLHPRGARDLLKGTSQ